MVEKQNLKYFDELRTAHLYYKLINCGVSLICVKQLSFHRSRWKFRQVICWNVNVSAHWFIVYTIYYSNPIWRFSIIKMSCVQWQSRFSFKGRVSFSLSMLTILISEITTLGLLLLYISKVIFLLEIVLIPGISLRLKRIRVIFSRWRLSSSL